MAFATREAQHTTAIHEDRLHSAAATLLEQVNQVVLGKQDVTSLVFATMLAGGHILFEDAPGVGKTTLAIALSKLIDLKCTRIQFTPDVTPSDVVGFSLFRPDTGTFEYQEGAVFCNLLLADEINRTSPKTQAALLEVMEERSVTVDGVTRPVPDPFFVVATQNPLGAAGTQPLPPSQLDRFMACTSMGYPSYEAELDLARGARAVRRTDGLAPCMGIDDLLAMQQAVQDIYIHDDLNEYIVRLITATRSTSRLEAGASPRATLALVRMSKAAAWLRGADYVLPTDIEQLFCSVVRHRVQLSAGARASGMDVDTVLTEILSTVQRPHMRSSARRRSDL